MRFVYRSLLAFGALWLAGMAPALAAGAQPVICKALAYLDTPDSRTPLRDRPAAQAPGAALLRNRQYLCVVDTPASEAVSGWERVMAVPLPRGSNITCQPGQADCTEMGNYPVAWSRSPPPATASCRLVIEPEDEGLTTTVRGTCPGGWLPAGAIRHFAD